MRAIAMTVFLSALLVAGGCTDQKSTTATTAAPTNEQVASTPQLTPEQLGELGAAIKKNPNDAQRLLTEKGLNEETFEQAVRKVSEDPAASKQYADAYKRAGA